jgi:uncharacterized protein with GYD domain
MPIYMHQWNYKDQQIQRMLDDVEEIDRAELVRTATEAFGGTLLNFYYCFGEFDGMAISEFPDEITALACVMSIYGQGRINAVRTTQLFQPDAGERAIRYAQEVLMKTQAPPKRQPPVR